MTPPIPELILAPPQPGTRGHDSYISASKIPAIMGVDPWGRTIHTVFERLLDPRDARPATDEHTKSLFRWGHAAERALVEYWEAETGHTDGYLETQPCYRAARDTGLDFPHLVTPDAVFHPGMVSKRSSAHWHIIEAKSGGRQGPLVPAADGPDLPISDAAQVLTQMGVTGARTGWLVRAPFARDETPEISQVTWNPDAFDLIVTTCRHLWNIVQQTRDDTDGTYDPSIDCAYLADSINDQLHTILTRKDGA